jgi:hypothetical protein
VGRRYVRGSSGSKLKARGSRLETRKWLSYWDGLTMSDQASSRVSM